MKKVCTASIQTQCPRLAAPKREYIGGYIRRQLTKSSDGHPIPYHTSISSHPVQSSRELHPAPSWMLETGRWSSLGPGYVGAVCREISPPTVGTVPCMPISMNTSPPTAPPQRQSLPPRRITTPAAPKYPARPLTCCSLSTHPLARCPALPHVPVQIKPNPAES